jgi:hypothetical protein
MTETALFDVKRWLRHWAAHWARTAATPLQIRMRALTGRTWSFN